MEKKKLDDFTKFKLVYCGELVLFSIVFAVIGTLFLTNVIEIKIWKYWVFPILTLAGGLWGIIDFIWLLNSKRRREKNSLLDKIIVLPVSTTVMVFDIYFLIINTSRMGDTSYQLFFRMVLGIILLIYCCIFCFQGIYRWFKPSKAILSAYAEAEEKEKQQNAAEQETKE